jgi:alanyl-tRNA synthetase
MRGKTFLFVVALASGAAYAQDTTDAAGQLESAAATTPKEKMDFATSAVAEMSASEKTVRKMLEQAQKEGESAASKVQCLNNKLASIRALQEVSDGANRSMQESLAANQTEMADFHFRKIAVAITKVRQFVAEAEACMGQNGTTGGTESIDVTGDTLAENVDDYFYDVEDEIPAPDATPFQ